MTAGIELMTRTMDGGLILNKLGRRRVKLCQRNVSCRNVSIFIAFLLPHPNCTPLSPNITRARGSDSLRITWYKKGEADDVLRGADFQSTAWTEEKALKFGCCWSISGFRTTGTSVSVDARETAPAAASENMFEGNPNASATGWWSSGVTCLSFTSLLFDKNWMCRPATFLAAVTWFLSKRNIRTSMFRLWNVREWFVPIWHNSCSDYSVLVKFTDFLWRHAQQRRASLQFVEK